jgi:membrane protein DedA with SNARE-associated domain
VIWAFAYVSVGSAAAGGYRELSRELHWAGYVFVAVIAAFIVVVFLVKKILQKREARHMAAADAPAAARSSEPPQGDER